MDLLQLLECRDSKVKISGKVVEVSVNLKNSICPVIPVSRTEYVDTRTGEYGEYCRSEDRSESKESLLRTFSRLRDLVNCNADPVTTRWVTLTYRENVRDPKRIYRDFTNFFKKFRRWSKKEGYGDVEYISVIEPQLRGAWHYHCFFIWLDKAPYVDANRVLTPMWGQGYTKCQKIDSSDNLGAYLTAYLCNIPFPDEPEDSKKFIKHGRLNLYPPNINIYRASRGVKKPVVEVMPYSEAMKKVSAATETYRVLTEVRSSDDDRLLNASVRRYYNTARAKSAHEVHTKCITLTVNPVRVAEAVPSIRANATLGVD